MTFDPVNAFAHHYVDADGIRTHYLASGVKDARTVVLVHGGGAGADAYGNWRLAIPAFAEAFRVVAVEMPGFGQTAAPDAATYEYSQADRNRHLIAFIEAIDGGAPVHLVGNSMGGATAIGVAVERPDLVSRLVLMGSAGLNAEITPALMPIIQYDFTEAGMRRLIAALTGKRYQVEDELVHYRHRLSVEPAVRAAYQHIMGWIRAQGGLFYPDEYIRRVRAPTLVVNGKDDLVVPVMNAYRFLELIDNSWGYIIPHCGHWAMLEAAEEFTPMARSFLVDASR